MECIIWESNKLNTGIIPDSSNTDYWVVVIEPEYTPVANDVCIVIEPAMYGFDPIEGGIPYPFGQDLNVKKWSSKIVSI